MTSLRALVLSLAVASSIDAGAQAVEPYRRDSLTADDYRRAERFMNYNANPLVLGGAVRPNWLPDDRFWYRNAFTGGFEFVLVDPARRTRLLSALQDSPVLLLRRGFWGLRTLIFLGYYTRPAVAAEIGWRAHPGGWSARGLPDEGALAAARGRSSPV